MFENYDLGLNSVLTDGKYDPSNPRDPPYCVLTHGLFVGRSKLKMNVLATCAQASLKLSFQELS